MLTKLFDRLHYKLFHQTLTLSVEDTEKLTTQLVQITADARAVRLRVCRNSGALTVEPVPDQPVWLINPADLPPEVLAELKAQLEQVLRARFGVGTEGDD